MQIPRISVLTPAALALAGALVLAGCGGSKQGGPQQGGAPAAPAVTVMTVRSEAVPQVTELPGRTTPSLIAEVRPQVTGIVKQRQFTKAVKSRSASRSSDRSAPTRRPRQRQGQPARRGQQPQRA